MNDLIEVRGLTAMGRHGWLPFERENLQPFKVDLDVEVDLSAAAASDDLVLTVDYGVVAKTVEHIISSTSYALLERLAEIIAREVLQLGKVQSVTVSLHKLRPPIEVPLDSAGVRITRRAAPSRQPQLSGQERAGRGGAHNSSSSSESGQNEG